MKKLFILGLAAIGLIFITSSCKKDKPVENDDPIIVVSDNSAELSKRISYVNEPLDIGGKQHQVKSATVVDPIVPTPEMDCSTGCTTVIDGVYNDNITIKNGDVVCITETGVFTGGIKMQGGTLSVCGTANVSYISTGRGTIVVNQTGTYACSSLSIDPQLTFAVYGTLDVPSWTSVSIKGQFENHSNMSFAAISVDAQGAFYNDGIIELSQGFVTNNLAENHGSMTMGGQLSINNNSSFVNTCSLSVGTNIPINDILINESFIEVGGAVYSNNNSDLEMGEGSLLTCDKIIINSDIYNTGSSYAMIQAVTRIAMNGGDVSGKIDLCCADGITNWSGTVGPEVSYCQAYIPPTDCNPGHGEPLLPEFTLVAEVDPPVLEGSNLSATSVQIIGDRAYVSYHLHGEPYGAAIEIFQLNATGTPVIEQQLLSTIYDFNELKLDDVSVGNTRKMWVMGSQNLSSSETLNSPAILAELVLQNELMADPYIDLVVDLEGYSGNSVQKNGNNLICVTGSDGGISVLDYTTKGINSFTTLDFAKYLSLYDNNLISLTASETDAMLYHYPATNPDYSAPDFSQSIGSIEPRDGKSVVHINGDKAYVACGAAGLKVFNSATLEGPVLSYNAEDGNSNGVDSDDDLVYVANGAGGMFILNRADLSVIGNYKFDGSANFVTAGGNNYIFLANGTGGLIIIHRNQ